MGILQEGDQLPTVKEVVSMIAVNPNTVSKAYRELEMLGLVEGKTGSGTYIKRRPPGPSPAVQTMLAEGLAVWMLKARQAGLDEEAIESLISSTLHNTRGVHAKPNGHKQ